MGEVSHRDDLTATFERKETVASVAVILISLVAILITWVFGRSYLIQRRRLPPGPRGLPVLGSLRYMGTNPNQALFELSKKYGPLMYMKLGYLPTVVVSNAAMAKEVLKTNDQVMASRPDMIGSTCLTYGRKDVAFAPYGPHWRQVRKICNLQLFTTSRINHFRDVRLREILAIVHSILQESEQGNAMSAPIFLGNLSMNLITQMMWNKKYRGVKEASLSDDQEATEFADMIREVMSLSAANNIADFVPALKPVVMGLQGLDQRMKAALHRMGTFIGKIVNEHEEAASSRAGTKERSDDADDFVDVLLRLSKQPDYSEVLSMDAIKAILSDMFAAGTDATSISLEWALAELLRCPGTMREVQDELMSVVGPDRLVTEEDICSLKYLQAVVKETFRLHPATPLGVPHLSTHNCTIDGFHVAANTMVFINIYAIHRDPAVWDQPLDFFPERFLDSPLDFKGQSYELIPFGSGRRMCPAVNLSSSVVHLALAQMLHVFTWTLAGDQKAEDLDMSEIYGSTCAKAIPLSVLAKPRLAKHVILSPPMMLD